MILIIEIPREFPSRWGTPKPPQPPAADTDKIKNPSQKGIKYKKKDKHNSNVIQ